MATEAFEFIQPIRRDTGTRLRDLALLAIAAGLPLGLFGLANLAGESLGLMPLFFAPFGLPGWVGAILHLSLLPLCGIAAQLAARHGGYRSTGWSGALILALIVFPFLAPALDSLQLSLLATSLLLLAGATTWRLARLSPLAGLVMVPLLIWLGISAALGLALAASWSPPFALMQGNGLPPEA